MNKKSVHIYRIASKYFFIPTASLTGTYGKDIEPITFLDEDDGFYKMGKYLHDAFYNCKIVDPQTIEGVSKKFLEISKTKSSKKLIEIAIYGRADLIGNQITIRRIGANKKYKAYMVDLGIPPVHLDLNTPNEAIGLAIRQLFSAE